MLFEFIFQVEQPNLTARGHAPINADALIEVVFEHRGNRISTLGPPYEVRDSLLGEVFFGFVPIEGLHRGPLRR